MSAIIREVWVQGSINVGFVVDNCGTVAGSSMNIPMVLPVNYYVTPALLHLRLPSQVGNTGPFEVATPRN